MADVSPQRPSLDPLAVVYFKELAAQFNLAYSKVHLGRLEAAGKFPKRLHLTPGRATWLRSEICAWIELRVAQRDTASVRQVPPPKPRTIHGRVGGNVKRATAGAA